MILMNMNPQTEIFHNYDFPVYTASKYRDPKLDTYPRILIIETLRFFVFERTKHQPRAICAVI